MENPYRHQPATAFWRPAVAERHPLDVEALYNKRFEIHPRNRIASAGSCFAQHIGRQMRTSGFRYLDVEPPPKLLPPERAQSFGYSMYSARYGNIYTARQLLQLVERAMGSFEPRDDIWETNGRYYDAFRPTIEPDGFGCRDEVVELRDSHLRKVKELLCSLDVLIFTFGLTEGWVSKSDGAVYPLCPGTAAGDFDSAKYKFHNFTTSEIIDDMRKVFRIVRSFNEKAKFLLTVSPVPLVATASCEHVLVATSHSKSSLRAAAGEISQSQGIAYFPSYEIISSPVMRGMFFEPDMREVNTAGVNHVMKNFFSAHVPPKVAAERAPDNDAGQVNSTEDDDEFALCDEILLDAENAN